MSSRFFLSVFEFFQPKIPQTNRNNLFQNEFISFSPEFISGQRRSVIESSEFEKIIELKDIFSTKISNFGNRQRGRFIEKTVESQNFFVAEIEDSFEQIQKFSSTMSTFSDNSNEFDKKKIVFKKKIFFSQLFFGRHAEYNHERVYFAHREHARSK